MIEPETPAVFNPADYPRRYAYTTPRLDWAVGYFIVMACFFGATYILAYHCLKSPLPDDYILFSWIALISGLIIAVLMVHEVEVEMAPYKIRVKKNFTDRTLERQDIKGWHHVRSWIRDGDFVRLVPLHPKSKAVMLKIDDFENLEVDDVFHGWHKSLPDLGQKKKDDYYEAVARTKALGSTREKRLQNMGYALRILDWHRYLLIAGFMSYFLLPNTYFPPLTDVAVITLLMLTIISISTIYRYPILLTEPPVGVGNRSYGPFLIISGWGSLLFLWFWRDAGLNGVGLYFSDISLNLYMVGIFLILFIPLLADRNWKQMPKRVLLDIYFILLASCAFYFYGNMALDRTQPTIKVSSYKERPTEDPKSMTPFLFADDDTGSRKMMSGCNYRYPGAFGTPWQRFDSCPENFQIPKNSK